MTAAVSDRSVVAVGAKDMDDGAVVLGNLEMKARRLSLTTNPEARAIRGARDPWPGAVGEGVGQPGAGAAG